MKRDDIVTVAPQGDFGKARPALIIQADLALPSATITYIPITSDRMRVAHVRVPIQPTPRNGLRLPSELMVDLIQTSTRSRFRDRMGSADQDVVQAVETALAIYLGLD